MSNTSSMTKKILPALLAALLVGCGGGGGGSSTSSTTPPTVPPDADTGGGGGTGGTTPPPAPATYTLGGAVAGIPADVGARVVLDAGSGAVADLEITADGAFTFDGELDSGEAYDVTVTETSDLLVCEVSNGQGTVANADITGVTVQCEAIGPDDSRSLPAEAQLAADLWALGQYGLVTELAAVWAGTPDGDTFFASTIEAMGSPVASAQSFNCTNGGTMVVSRWVDGEVIYDGTGNPVGVNNADGLFNTPDEQTVAFTDCDMFGVPEMMLTSVSFPGHSPYVARANGVSLAGPFKLSGRMPVPMAYKVGGAVSPSASGGLTFTRSSSMNPQVYAYDDAGTVLAMIQNTTMTYTDEFSSASGYEETDFTVDFQAPVDVSDPFYTPIPVADLTTPTPVELDSNDYMVGGEMYVVDHRGSTPVGISITPNADPTLVTLAIDYGNDGSFEVTGQTIRWDAFTDDSILTRFSNRGGFN